LPASAILKLYDRRCLVNTRDTYDKGMPWSLDKQREHWWYLHHVATSAVARRDFDNPTYWKNPVPHGEFQAYLQHTAQKVFHAELAMYERLRPLQGKKTAISHVVEYKIAVSDACADESTVSETVSGLLLKHVPLLTLRELVAT
ncbi:hypothetical protein LXA43DRAFT_845083, partial [Ganoderma leucocontextum]